MKKRPSKPRLPKKPSLVAEECAEYRQSVSEYICEVETWMRKDDGTREWIDTALAASRMNRVTQVHHIYGRSKHPESNWFCALVQVFKATHDAGHDRNPNALEVCSLMSKLERHRRYLDLREIGIVPIANETQLHWNVDAMSVICGSPTLQGRLEGIILPKLIGTTFEPMCIALIEELSK